MKRGILFALVAVVLLSVAAPALAQEHAAGEVPPLKDFGKFIGAAVVLGLAAFAGALGQGKSVAAACTSMGRNPGAAGPVRITMIIGLAFIESLVIYSLLIAFIILGK